MHKDARNAHKPTLLRARQDGTKILNETMAEMNPVITRSLDGYLKNTLAINTAKQIEISSIARFSASRAFMISLLFIISIFGLFGADIQDVAERGGHRRGTVGGVWRWHVCGLIKLDRP